MASDNSLSHLVKDVLRDIATLVQNEIRLGRAEFALGIENARAAILQVILGLAFAIPAITLLAAAGGIALSQLGVSLVAGLAASGGVLSLFAAIMFLAARRNAGSRNTQMRETTENLK